jgi:hypothetical protein
MTQLPIVTMKCRRPYGAKIPRPTFGRLPQWFIERVHFSSKIRSYQLPQWFIERVHFSSKIRSYHGVIFIDCLRCERWTMIFGLHFVAIVAMRSYRFLRQAGALIRK